MQADYALAYRDLYERHWWWRAREMVLLKTLREVCPSGRSARILDVGCGDGLLFDQLGALGEVYGVEPDASLVTEGGPHAARIHVGPFDPTYTPAEPFDVVLMLDVLEHLEDASAALRHVTRLLRSGGRLVVTVPAFMALWTGHDDINQHLTRYTKHSFAALLEDEPLRLDDWRYFSHWTAAVKWVLHWCERLLRAEPTPARVPNPLVNRILYALSRAEETMFGRLRLPFGSSLLAVLTRA
jgi:2-polyprenyl-3-methyl-5-hydroxy-6-metoxy-1,4-benzoquinol methylase